MRKLYLCLTLLFLCAISAVGVISLCDEDPTVSRSENRQLAKLPAYSWQALTDGTYISGLDAYYTDTFPGRETLLQYNKMLNRFYYYTTTDSGLLITYEGEADQGGEALDEVLGQHETPDSEETEAQNKPTETEPTTGSEPESPEEPEKPEEETPKPESELQVGTILLEGDRAMDIPTATWEIIDSYAEAINNLAGALPEVRTINLVTPNGGQFYSSEEFHTGLHDQKAMIERCYSGLDDAIIAVDAYSQIEAHQDEYLFFRTDHHWTQRGAYYAYVAFCEAMGFEAVPLDQFETGTYDNFLGTMYTYTSAYPQSEALKENPDTLEYYLPIVETHAKYYSDTTLSDGVPISVIYQSLEESVSNKYLCLIGGDHPVTIIESAAEGPVCMVLKESYGNAFVPFLTSHYSKIIVIDPREFNQNGKPELQLAQFAQEQGVSDLIVINYPFMINNSNYIGLLNALAGK